MKNGRERKAALPFFMVASFCDASRRSDPGVHAVRTHCFRAAYMMRAFTWADTAAMSARPARRVLSRAMTLPMTAGPVAP